jgi:hypothetical protein
MGLGHSVEALGDLITTKDNRHFVKEGLAIAGAYILVRYFIHSITTNGDKASTFFKT